MRVRFAPSPTGHLHIGGARTALFNWLLARKSGGAFVLRIEDTDTARSTQAFETEIIEDLRWLGLDWDEGPETGGPNGPYRQSERGPRYTAAIEQLLETGKAYRCTCTPDRLAQVRAAQQAAKENPRYDRHCRELNLGPDCGDHVVRFRTPIDGATVIQDGIKGDVEIRHSELDDLVICRTNGTPVYNLVVVVDDLEMGITHVVRGDDHLNNTPKQVLLYEALGAKTPAFAHLPLILGPDGSRLSKRHGATSVGSYREQGFLPEAMVNYLARLGWAHGDDEVFSSEDLVAAFGLDGVGKSGAKWDLEKLTWLNQTWMKRCSPEELVERTRPFFALEGVDLDARAPMAVATMQERAKTLAELAQASRFYFVPDDELEYEDKPVKKFLKASTQPVLEQLADTLQEVSPWTESNLSATVEAFLVGHELKLGKVAQPVRVSITGRGVGPGLYEMLVAVGKDSALARIREGASRCGSMAGA